MIELQALPALNASLNAASAAWLTAGWILIRLGRRKAHAACMTAAMATSALFLCSYLYYHAHHGVTRFQGQGLLRTFYFVVLTSHTVLAVVVLPMALLTFFRAVRGDLARHKAVARWTLPIWLYVAVTGVVVYWMLYRL